MTDDLVKRLRDKWQHSEELCYVSADRIENLEEEVGILISASIRLASRIDIDSDAYDDRIEELEAALQEIAVLGYWDGDSAMSIARKALEGKND